MNTRSKGNPTRRRGTSGSGGLTRAELRDMIERLPAGVCITDSMGRVVESNSMMSKIAGGLLPIEPFHLWHIEGRNYETREPLVEEAWPANIAIATKRPVIGKEIGIVKVDGTSGSFLVSAMPLKDRIAGIDGQLAISIVQDITGKKQQERMIFQQAMELKRSNEELEQFAYVASHDLREPLRVISNYMGLLQRRCKNKLDEAEMKYINVATDASIKMQTLIDDMLTYSRASKGQDFEEIDMNKALEVAIDRLKMLVNDNGAEIACDTLPKVRGDFGQMVQIFQNLIENSIKYRSPNTPRIEVSASRKGNLWTVAVRDNGLGIAPQYHDRIFQLFQRLGDGRSGGGGTGLGLAIVRRMVDRHGGHVWVESEEGKGATFLFTLPVAEDMSEVAM